MTTMMKAMMNTTMKIIMRTMMDTTMEHIMKAMLETNVKNCNENNCENYDNKIL